GVGWVTFATAVGWLLLTWEIIGRPRPGLPFPWIILLPGLIPVITFALLASWMPGGFFGRGLPHRVNHTLYLITDRRVAIMEGGRPYSVRSLAPAMLTHLVRRERPDGSGDLIVAREPGTLSEGWAGGRNSA